MLWLIDNFDSFTFNLVQYFEELGEQVRVVRNDASLDSLKTARPSRLVVSPGPGVPSKAGITPRIFTEFTNVPVLGVCLGHQALAESFGAKIVHAPTLVHGKTSSIVHDGRTIFAGLPNPLVATRYHSLCVDASSLPTCLEVSAHTGEGEAHVIMGLRHRRLPFESVQFHPESILTTCGRQLLSNWLQHTAPKA